MKTRIQRTRNGKRIIDLKGPEGNAYYLLSLAEAYSEPLHKDFDTIYALMTSGDYTNLVTVFIAEFGLFVEVVGPY